MRDRGSVRPLRKETPHAPARPWIPLRTPYDFHLDNIAIAADPETDGGKVLRVIYDKRDLTMPGQPSQHLDFRLGFTNDGLNISSVASAMVLNGRVHYEHAERGQSWGALGRDLKAMAQKPETANYRDFFNQMGDKLKRMALWDGILDG